MTEEDKGFVASRERGQDQCGDAPSALPAMSAPLRAYRGYSIYPTDPLPPIPCWRMFAWTYCHEDYDGPEDGRYGHAASAEACREEIDEALDQ